MRWEDDKNCRTDKYFEGDCTSTSAKLNYANDVYCRQSGAKHLLNGFLISSETFINQAIFWVKLELISEI
jgi:hypothetical protein